MRVLSIFLLGVLGLTMSGCRSDSIQVYKAPKDPIPVFAETQEGDAPSQVHWAHVPASWKEGHADGMRRGSFTITGTGNSHAEVTLVALPGQSGGLLANVNRWRGQVGLSPVSEDQLLGLIHKFSVGKLKFRVVILDGQQDQKPTRLVAAVLETQSETWFIKLMGPTELVKKNEASFQKFLGGLKVDEGASR